MDSEKFKRKEMRGQQTLGERFKQVREEDKHTLNEVARAIGVQAKYLAAIEESRYQDLPGPVYVRAFVKRYAEFLALNPELVLRRFDDEQRVVTGLNPPHRWLPIRAGLPRAVFTPSFWRRAAVIAAILLVIGYLGIELNRYIAAPQLIVSEPADNLRTTEAVIVVAGITAPESTLRFNGQEVSVAPDGSFRESVSLLPGVNTLTLETSRKRSRTRTVVRHVLREVPAGAGTT